MIFHLSSYLLNWHSLYRSVAALVAVTQSGLCLLCVRLSDAFPTILLCGTAGGQSKIPTSHPSHIPETRRQSFFKSFLIQSRSEVEFCPR